MEELFIKVFFAIAIATIVSSCSVQTESTPSMNIEEIKIGGESVLDSTYSVNQINYYRYINSKHIVKTFGEPDKTQLVVDELMETEILRLIYGNSYIQFYDHTFGGGLAPEHFSLYSIDFNDSRLWVEYLGDTLKVGQKFGKFYPYINEEEIVVVTLNKALIKEVSEYILTVEYEEEIVKRIYTIF